MQRVPVLFSAVLLLLLYVAGHAAAQSRCMYDEIVEKSGPPPIAVMREIPLKGSVAGQTYTAVAAETLSWEPIRIFVSSADLEDPTKYCNAEAANNGEKRPDFRGDTRKCSSDDEFTTVKKTLLLTELIPSAIKLHSDRLLVEKMRTNLVVPKLDDTACKHFKIPPGHNTSGVADADKVLYVSTTPGPTWAMTCAALSTSTGRPIASAMTFATSLIALTQERVRTSAHELAHALGFTLENMKAHQLIKSVSNLRGKTSEVSVVTGAKTKAAVQKHFNCSTADGMELEDEGATSFPGTHWERRNAKDELMNAYVGIGLYTALTMSLFEDLGYYKARWGMEEPMSWGLNAGCPFLENKCIENGRNAYPEMFCTEAACDEEAVCTSDRMALGKCGLETPKDSLPTHLQYFADPTRAGAELALTDYCPIVSRAAGYCMNGKAAEVMKKIGSRVGEGSWCLKGDALTIDGRSVGDVCAEVRCLNDKTVEVRYLGDEAYHVCREGSALTPTATFSGGKILCPKFEEVCTVADNGASLVTIKALSA